MKHYKKYSIVQSNHVKFVFMFMYTMSHGMFVAQFMRNLRIEAYMRMCTWPILDIMIAFL